jgi:hypothetical protein
MFKNYIKATLRNIKKHKIYSFINISGLAVGIACCLLILLFVRDELSFENFHDKADWIYRVIIDEYVDAMWEHNGGFHLPSPARQSGNGPPRAEHHGDHGCNGPQVFWQ